jgi:hypothetical protein
LLVAAAPSSWHGLATASGAANIGTSDECD